MLLVWRVGLGSRWFRHIIRAPEWSIVVVALEVSGMYLRVRARSGMGYLHNAGTRCSFAITSLCWLLTPVVPKCKCRSLLYTRKAYRKAYKNDDIKNDKRSPAPNNCHSYRPFTYGNRLQHLHSGTTNNNNRQKTCNGEDRASCPATAQPSEW